MQGTHTGVGPALRKARLRRGLTIREASQDTHIRPELLEALEKERFEELLGEVYVRGALRSYSSYLGLDADKVVTVYARAREEEVAPPPPPRQPDEIGRAIAAKRRRDDNRLLLLAAVTVLVLAGAFGVLSRSRSAPTPADLPPTPVAEAAPSRAITVVLAAHREVEVTVVMDGAPPETFTLRRAEERSFVAKTLLTVHLADGGAVSLSVNGVDRGRPGEAGVPWRNTFRFGVATPPPVP